MSRPPHKKPLSTPAPPLSPLPPPTETSQGLWRWALPLIVLLYIGLAVAHAHLVPTGATGYQNAPDEAAHVVYVRAIAHGMLPARTFGETVANGYEWHQPPLYYALTALFLPLGEQGLRYASILCGIAAILLIYRTARLIFPNDPVLASVAAGIAALTPTHIAITSTVNNDALLEVCFSVTLFILVASFFGGFTFWRAGWLGAAIGAAMLTKATGLLLIPIALFGLILIARAKRNGKRIVRDAAWSALIIVIISGWWYLRNASLYGELLPLKAFRESFAGTVQARDVMAGKVGLPVDGWSGYFALVAQWTFQSFWAVYGTARSAQVGAPRFLPAQLYLLFGGISLTAFAGLIKLHLRRKQDFTEAQQHILWVLFATVGLVGLSFVGFVVTYFQTQGRYLYPAMLPLCILTAAGWRAVFPERYRSLASGMLLALLAASAFAFLRYVAPV